MKSLLRDTALRDTALRDTAISATAPSPSAIALCAFTLWVDQGRPKNTNEAIWLEAEKQLITRKA